MAYNFLNWTLLDVKAMFTWWFFRWKYYSTKINWALEPYTHKTSFCRGKRFTVNLFLCEPICSVNLDSQASSEIKSQLSERSLYNNWIWTLFNLVIRISKLWTRYSYLTAWRHLSANTAICERSESESLRPSDWLTNSLTSINNGRKIERTEQDSNLRGKIPSDF